MSAESAIDALLALAERDPQPDTTPVLLAIAHYCESVIEATDGMWPPYVRASTCRTALRNIAEECRRESATATTDDEENACQPR